MTPLRIIIAEDQLIVRAGFRTLLDEFADIKVVAEASNGEEAVELSTQLRPDMVLMDISMPGRNGLDATRQIVATLPDVRVIVLSMHTGKQHVHAAFRAGVSGYVLKGAPPHELRLALESVSRGGYFLSPAISKHVIAPFLSHAPERPNSPDLLTARQREILQLIAEGKSTKQIARTLNSSVKTIEAHRVRLMARLRIHDLAGLVRYAVRHGIASEEA
ncbi:MAG: response regulator transcription factor [Alphaproteobacteria bacterium]|nr:response regulator transcription factor [Alphaproteobacteria bacterium]